MKWGYSVAIAGHAEIRKITVPYSWTWERSPCPRYRCDQFARICWCARSDRGATGFAAWPTVRDRPRKTTTEERPPSVMIAPSFDLRWGLNRDLITAAFSLSQIIGRMLSIDSRRILLVLRATISDVDRIERFPRGKLYEALNSICRKYKRINFAP